MVGCDPTDACNGHFFLPILLIVLPAKSVIFPVFLSTVSPTMHLPFLIFLPKLATIFKVILLFLGMSLLYITSVLMPASVKL